MTDITTHGIIANFPGTTDTLGPIAERYETVDGPLGFDLYRPRHASGPLPAVVFVTGYPDPGATAMFGKPLKDWASYRDWARLVAAAGLVGVTYENRTPADAVALVRHLRANAAALELDPDRIGYWSCSGNVPNALALTARARPRCAALLYGYFLDLDGATHVADALGRYGMQPPAVALADLPHDVPLLVVRAGRDASPGLDESLQAFVAAGRARGLDIELLDHPEAPHAFDLVDGGPETRDVIEAVVAFLRRRL